YGINDNYHPTKSHVLPALIRKFHEAKVNGEKTVTVWGSGKPLREFLYADDLADACLFLMDNYNELSFVNIGVGEDLSIHELAMIIKEVIGFDGELEFDASKPDGTPRKLMDVSKLKELGWSATTSLQDGIKLAYQDFLSKEPKGA